MKAILTWHSIDDSGSPISVAPAAFARQVAWLASGQVRVTTVEELLRLPDSADAVAVTFDDGFRNVAERAAPLLAAHALPATIFVVSRHAGTNAWGGVADAGVPTLPLLNWDELARLREQGFSVAAHSRTHRRMGGAGAAVLEDELLGCAQDIAARTGEAPRGFAYPYGDVDAAAADMVRRHYDWGCTTELRVLTAGDDRACLPRVDMYYFRDPGRLERWGSARFRCYLTLRHQARRVRRRFVATGSSA